MYLGNRSLERATAHLELGQLPKPSNLFSRMVSGNETNNGEPQEPPTAEQLSFRTLTEYSETTPMPEYPNRRYASTTAQSVLLSLAAPF